MGQISPGCATTTQTVRRAIQNSQASLKTLSERYSINKKTVAKWRKRDFVHDAPMGPKHPRSTVLTPKRKPSVSPFVNIRCCPWMTAYIPCNLPSPILLAHLCTACFNATGSVAYQL